MNRHICLIETSHARLRDPRFHRCNMAPMAIWDMREGSPFAVSDTARNALIEETLAATPPNLRAVRFDWFADSRLPAAAVKSQIDRVAEVIANIGGVELVYCDNEEWPRDSAEMTKLLAPLASYAKLLCNFNSATRGVSWWGPTPPNIGNAACVQAYEATTNAAMSGLMSTMRAFRPCVLTFPICCRQTRAEYAEEINTANVMARTRQAVMYASSLDQRVFTCAEYMLPDDQIDRYLDVLERAMLDADVVVGAGATLESVQ